MINKFLTIVVVLSLSSMAVAVQDLNNVIANAQSVNSTTISEVRADVVGLKNESKLKRNTYAGVMDELRRLEIENNENCIGFKPQRCLDTTKEIQTQVPYITRLLTL